MNTTSTYSEAMKHYYRGKVLEISGDLEGAVSEYKKAIELHYEAADVHNALGRVLLRLGNPTGARAEFEYALKLNPEYLEAKKNLELLLEQKKQYGEDILTRKVNIPLELPKIRTAGYQMRNKKILLSGILALGIIAIVAIGYKFLSRTGLSGEGLFDVDAVSISSIARSQNKIILTDWISKQLIVYQIKKDGFFKNTTIKLKNDIVPSSIGIMNRKIYILDGWNKNLYRGTLGKARISLTKVQKIKEQNPAFIAVCGDKIFIFDNVDRQFYIYDSELKKVGSKKSPVDEVLFTVSDGKRLYLLDKKYTLSIADSSLNVFRTCDLSVMSDKTISAIFVDGKYVWAADEVNKCVYYWLLSE